MMPIKILYIENEDPSSYDEQQYLKGLGFWVYPSRPAIAEHMLHEVHPDLCYLEGSRETWSSLEEAIGQIPRVYGILEDELYWVERSGLKHLEISLCDNLLDGVRVALASPKGQPSKEKVSKKQAGWHRRDGVPEKVDQINSGRKSA